MRIKTFDEFVNESREDVDEDKIAILLDGTSSAGKSYTSGLLNAVPYNKATDPNKWVIIGSDDFGGINNEGEENRLKLDPPSIRDWAKGNDSGIVSGLYREDDSDMPPNPKENEYIKGTDPRLWYMAEEYKTGPWKKVIFDDIGKDILKYVPNIKHNILLHTPLYILLQNIGERNQKEKGDYRDPTDVLSQYLNKYEATKQKPNESHGDPTTVLTGDGLRNMLYEYINDESYIDNFIKTLGVTEDGDYYIKVKDSYMTDNTQLINVDSDRMVYLDKFKSIVNNEFE
jgi:hypothetical protein